jgi:hypothetical protein
MALNLTFEIKKKARAPAVQIICTPVQKRRIKSFTAYSSYSVALVSSKKELLIAMLLAIALAAAGN